MLARAEERGDEGGTMSQKQCDVCGDILKDKDPIVAIIQSVYREIPSAVAFSMGQPTDCYDVAHLECYHMEEDANYDD